MYRSNLPSSSSPTPSLTLQTTPSTAERDTHNNDIIGALRSESSPEMRREALSAMMAQENMEVYQCCDYLSSYDDHWDCDGTDHGVAAACTSGNYLNAACRTSICEWMYRVVDHFGVDREVVAVALSYTDRLLSLCQCPTRQLFNLISCTSLHLAIKIHSPWMWKEVGPLLPSLSRGDFDQERLVEMENEMTNWLQWYLNQTTPQCMVLHLLSLLDEDRKEDSVPSRILGQVADTALFLIELSVCDYHFVPIRTSIVAIAAILNAIEMVGLDLDNVSRDASSFFSYRNDLRQQMNHVLSSIHYKVNWVKAASARERLWCLYRNSTEYCGSSVRQGSSTTGRGMSMGNDTPPSPVTPKRLMVQQVSSPTSCCDANAKRFRCRSDFVFTAISGVPSLEFSVSSDSQDQEVSSDVSCVGARYSF